ncbi:MAG: hypothetical protein HQL98_07420 [Magnetococcales bacterium]|nr:hypothetical protein [Magnetococcales bacterium]
MPSAYCLIYPPVEVPGFLLGDLYAKMAYVDELVVRVTPDPSGAMGFHLRREPNAVEKESLIRKVQRATRLLVETTREPMIKIVEDYMDRPVCCRVDPMESLLARGEVVQTDAGLFSLGPLVASLCRFFENRLFEVGLSQGAGMHRFPAMVPASFLEKIQYFKNFPHSLSFASHLREDLEIVERFAAETVCRDGTIHPPEGALSGIRQILAPTVCHHFYLFLANRTLPRDPVVATAQGHCFRYESINMHSLERLWGFTMWEVIFVGSAPRVKESLTRAGTALHALLAEWGLAYRLENATDPFFIREFGAQSGFQNIYDLKYEYRARLPFKEGTLAAGSRNYHQDFFGRHMGITLPDGRFAHSGCIGFGLERLAFAFLAQHGTEFGQWPESVREGLNRSGFRIFSSL